MRDVVILGSTGSIGTQALDIVRGNLGTAEPPPYHRRPTMPAPV